ncbi:hypothetical protein DICSQDRAFT_155138 [Dichomitus squalens LYAD-421 SS1]|uniref:Uncharacterized protein n=1 Tax=Dichomitus squalens (strain LYAD-421) TaxID=732165 RepID=R7T021_DICSQ|nr:uncharacterized protein DICSQDRAFT_155138 [Dichomitus squalens LYAD-421 SS1]EJF61330.1 hypothetical protein DICSQDRAFT_155138 [Dichomitus squalens LYAD-421 SS1]
MTVSTFLQSFQHANRRAANVCRSAAHAAGGQSAQCSPALRAPYRPARNSHLRSRYALQPAYMRRAITVNAFLSRFRC